MYNDKIKKCIYQWRESNKEAFGKYRKEYNAEWYAKNKKFFNQQRKDKYHIKVFWQSLCNIDVEGL